MENYERKKELRVVFDESKAGVKGLVDAGVQKIPEIFVRPAEELAKELKCLNHDQVQVPVIDFDGLRRPGGREKIVDEIRVAAMTWGFFQLVNHGIPIKVLDGMIDGVCKFHEQDSEGKKKLYTRDPKRTVQFVSNFDLFKARAANWRDTLTISIPPSNHVNPDDLPDVCRASTLEYTKYVKKLGVDLFGFLSEALGLETERLASMECAEGHRLVGHYYPACPEPELTLGIYKHSDPGFLTILLQNEISGLQVLYENSWLDIQPIPGALVINIGDLLQLVSNGKLRSNQHRAIANKVGPRISVACFFAGPISTGRIYGPIEELISEDTPPLYRGVQLQEHVAKFLSRGLDDEKLLLDYYIL